MLQYLQLPSQREQELKYSQFLSSPLIFPLQNLLNATLKKGDSIKLEI